MEFDAATQQFGQLALDREEAQPRHVTRVEFDQHVYVARRAEVIPQHGTKERKFADVVFAAEFGDSISRQVDPDLRLGFTPSLV